MLVGKKIEIGIRLSNKLRVLAVTVNDMQGTLHPGPSHAVLDKACTSLKLLRSAWQHERPGLSFSVRSLSEVVPSIRATACLR